MTLLVEFLLLAAAAILIKTLLDRLTTVLHYLNTAFPHRGDTHDGIPQQSVFNQNRSQPLTSITPNSQTEDIYRRKNTVPPNPPRLTLDYSTLKTCEGRLKAAILHDSASNIVEVIAEGMGGVGKTCALQGLAEQPDVQNRFHDGLLFIKLGNHATRTTVMKAIVNIVRATGGKHLAKELDALTTLEQVVNDAADRFNSKSCLFLVDDVWRANDINSSVLLTLTKLVNVNSRLAYTTRDIEISIEGQMSIHFHIKDRILSREILMNHAYDSELTLCHKNQKALEHILDVCAGHPLALGVAGGSVRRAAQCMRKHQLQNALSRIAAQMRSADGESQIDNSTSGISPVSDRDVDSVIHINAFKHPYYGRITRVVDASLSVLENDEKLSSSILFKKLSILQKQQKPPIAMLQKLWGMKSMREVHRVAKLFHNVSIMQLYYNDDDDGDFFELHDLVLDIARDKAGKQTSKYISSMLNRYMEWRRYNHRQWWECEDDGYLYDNLCRLLYTGTYKKELLWMLERPQWIIMRLQMKGASAVEGDISYALRYSWPNGQHIGSQWRHSVVVKQASNMSHLFILNNSYEAWFQMHGRLLMFARECIWTRLFVEEMEKCAVRPWAKPTIGFLEAAGGSLQHIVPCQGKVVQVTMVDNKLNYLTNDVFASYNITNGEQILLSDVRHIHKEYCFALDCDGARMVNSFAEDLYIMDVESGKPILPALQGHSGCVICVAFSKDGGRIVSGSRDRTVRVWDVRSGKLVCAPFEGHSRNVTCVSFSTDGNRIVSGSDDKTIRVWDVESGELIGIPFEGHTDFVTCVAFSTDGKRIVSGSVDQSVRVWDIESGELVGAPHKGNASTVMCVAFSKDGKCIVSGSFDECVRVWEVESENLKGIRLEGHTDCVTCVDFSADGKHVVSGSYDKTVRVWDIEVAELVGPPSEERSRNVTCLAFSADQKCIVSGSDDGTVRVWDVESGEIIGSSFEGHTEYVTCVAFSADSRRIVSGLGDGSLRVWNVESAELVNALLEGHTTDVTCVAFSMDGRRIVSGSYDKAVVVWNVESGELVGAPLEGHNNKVSCVAFSADGKLIVSGSDDRTVRVWSIESGELVSTVPMRHSSPVTFVDFSTGGKYIVSRSSDGSGHTSEVISGKFLQAIYFDESENNVISDDTYGLYVVSKDTSGLSILWDVRSGQNVRSSENNQWILEICKLSFSWQDLDRFLDSKHILQWPSSDRTQILATIPFSVYRLGKYIFKESFTGRCQVVEKDKTIWTYDNPPKTC